MIYGHWNDPNLFKHLVLYLYLLVYLFRFVNMIALSQLEDETLWNMTKTKRLKYLIDNVNELGTSWCFSSDDRILKEISYLDDLAWSNNLYNFRDEQFESAAKMFIYLNTKR